MIGRAFVLEPDRRYRVDRAGDHGEIAYLFDSACARLPWWSHQFGEECLSRLADMRYDPSVDFVVVSGDQAAVAVLLAAVTAHHGAIQMLVYEPGSARYILQSV